jgi:protein Mpv17
MRVFQWYFRLIKEHPIKTKSTTSFFTFGMGDYLCQIMQNEKTEGGKNSWRERLTNVQMMRIIKQASFGFLITPYFHFNWSYLIPKLFPKKNMISTVKTLVYSQFVSSPIYLFLFFAYLDALSGKSFNEFLTNYQNKFQHAFFNNLKVWPLANAISFLYIPSEWRILFGNFVGIFWNIYLSYLQNEKQLSIDEIDKEIKLEAHASVHQQIRLAFPLEKAIKMKTYEISLLNNNSSGVVIL